MNLMSRDAGYILDNRNLLSSKKKKKTILQAKDSMKASNMSSDQTQIMRHYLGREVKISVNNHNYVHDKSLVEDYEDDNQSGLHASLINSQ